MSYKFPDNLPLFSEDSEKKESAGKGPNLNSNPKPDLRIKIGGLKEEQFSVEYCSSSQELQKKEEEEGSSTMSDSSEDDQSFEDDDEVEEKTTVQKVEICKSSSSATTVTTSSLLQIAISGKKNNASALESKIENDGYQTEVVKDLKELVVTEGDKKKKAKSTLLEKQTSSPPSDSELLQMALTIVNRQEARKRKRPSQVLDESFEIEDEEEEEDDDDDGGSGSNDGSNFVKKKIKNFSAQSSSKKKASKKNASRLSCPADGCTTTLASANGLRRHKLRTHIGLKPFFCHFGYHPQVAAEGGGNGGNGSNGGDGVNPPPCPYTAYHRHEVLHHVMKEHGQLKYEDAEKHVFSDQALLRQIERRLKALA